MDSELDRQLLGVLMDDSLEPSMWRSLHARIAADPCLQREFQNLCRLRKAVRQNASRYTAPASLRARVQMISIAPAATRRPALWDWRRALGVHEVVGWRHAAALGVGALALSAIVAGLPRSQADERLMHAAASSYRSAVNSAHLVDVASPDAGVVQPWLSERLSFRVPVEVPALGGATLLGGRLDRLDSRSVAALVYRLGGHTVHEFVWSAHDDSSRVRSESVAGLNLSHWSRGGLRYCVVSDLPQEQLVAFAQSLAQAGGAQEVNE